MRKLIYLGMSVALLVTAASCTLNRLEEPAASGKDGTQITFTATVPGEAPGTKTLLVDDGPDIYWAPNDEIMIFSRGWGQSSFRSNNSEPSKVAEFPYSVYGRAGAISPEDQYWAVYPSSWDHVWFDQEGGSYVEVSLPPNQTAIAGTFDPKALFMTARSASTDLPFYHIGGGLKFKLTQDWVQQVEFRSNDGTSLAGYVQVVMDEQGHPVVSELYETVDAVLLTAPRGETLQPDTWYYLCCLPAVLEQGYTLTFRSETQTGVSVHSGPAEVKRATWGVLEAADTGVVPEDARNDLYGDTIYYASTDGNIVEPQNVWGFGANIISNTYESGQGVILFDGPVTGIPNSAFSGKNTLESIQLPSTVWEIGGWAFSDCTSLRSIVMNESLASIQDYVFRNTGITELTPPGRLRIVTPYAFRECNSLSAFQGPLATSDGHGLVIEGTLVAFAQGALEYPVDYVIEEGITGLADEVFSSVQVFRDVTLPESLETIGEKAFFFCNKLRAFHGKFASEDGHLLIKDGEIVSSALRDVTDLVIPGTVRSIAPQAFAQKSSLRQVVISEGVEQIGDEAFEFCNSINEITLPESLTSLGERVFQYCYNIQTFHGKYAFGEGKFLVEDGALKAVALNGIREVNVPESVTSLASSVFHGTNITAVSLPDGLIEIGDRAFMYCRDLTGITLPESLRAIGNEAFYGCDNVAFTTFTIPAGVTQVGYNIISNCSNLSKVTVLPSTPPVVPPGYSPIGSFNDAPPTIFVPAASLQAYQEAEGWRYQGGYQAISE